MTLQFHTETIFPQCLHIQIQFAVLFYSNKWSFTTGSKQKCHQCLSDCWILFIWYETSTEWIGNSNDIIAFNRFKLLHIKLWVIVIQLWSLAKCTKSTMYKASEMIFIKMTLASNKNNVVAGDIVDISY